MQTAELHVQRVSWPRDATTMSHSTLTAALLLTRIRSPARRVQPLFLGGQIEHHASFDPAGLQVSEDRVDAVERRRLDIRADPALGGKGDRFIEIVPG